MFATPGLDPGGATQGECEAFVRAKRSAAAAQRRPNATRSPGLDGDAPMGPPANDV